MSTGTQPTSTPALNPNVVYGFLAAILVVVIAIGGYAVMRLEPGKPIPASPIPALTKAHLLAYPPALRAVAADIKLGKSKSDAASLTASIAAARKSSTDALATAIQTGDVAANLDAVADAAAGVIRGSK